MPRLNVQSAGIKSRKLHLLLPNAPANLIATNQTSTSVDLSWDAVEHAGGYKIYQDGAEIATSTTNSYTVSGLTTATTYEFYVTAIHETEGTESAPSNIVTVTTL